MVPHEPYIYDARCGHREPYWPITDGGAEAARVRAAYTSQIQCLNAKLLYLLTALRARSPTEPIILLQGDHGHGRLGRHLPAFEVADEESRSERASVFAAYAFPGVSTDSLPEDITPVNALRFVLREYFGDTLAPLEDITYWSSDRYPYRFVRMPADPPSGAHSSARPK
jgi:hypothetical protein